MFGFLQKKMTNLGLLLSSPQKCYIQTPDPSPNDYVIEDVQIDQRLKFEENKIGRKNAQYRILFFFVSPSKNIPRQEFFRLLWKRVI